MLWIAGAKAVDFDEHDQAGVAGRCRRIFSAARGAGRDRLGLLIGHHNRLADIPSECDPELSTTPSFPPPRAFHHIDHPDVAVRVDH
jgi:hypothetical protein